MRKFLAILKKESLILIRDKVGLAILFIMPMILIFIMTLIQDAAIKTINEKGFPIIYVDNDNDSLGKAIYSGLKASTLVSLKDSINGKKATENSAKRAVAEGKFILGIIIPKFATSKIKKNVKSLVDLTLGLKKIDNIAFKDSVNIKIISDPIAKKSIVSSISSNLHEFISTIKSKIMFQTFSGELAKLIPSETKLPKSIYKKTDIVRFEETYASDIVGEVVPNSVQHNVPAWTIFGMFFIVISIVGNLVKEKNEGSFFRLNTIPTHQFLFLWGKVTTYLMLNMIQFILMLSVGIFFLPFLGMPALNLGENYFALFLMAISTSFAAIGFGILIGTLAMSEQQGAILGSLSILLLAAIGGILVPTYIMPELMRKISVISPLNWSLEGIYQILFRGSGVSGIITYVLRLFLFFIFTFSFSILIYQLKNKK